jgi:phage-related protein
MVVGYLTLWRKENMLYTTYADEEKFTINFYRDRDGSKPVGDFIRSLDVKIKAKVVSDLHILEILGNTAREPLSKHVSDGIFELRSIAGSTTIRILYFFDGNKVIIATNGFVKKQQKTPLDEINKAKQRRNLYYEEKEKTNG